MLGLNGQKEKFDFLSKQFEEYRVYLKEQLDYYQEEEKLPDSKKTSL